MSGSKASGLEYRPDIDGLRAIAVLAVIGFHAGIGGFRGGDARRVIEHSAS
jgi:peptidoglycan/LPS O-acetylase OafA/YrhL